MQNSKSTFHSWRSHVGFTLIELLVVIAIIAVLGAGVITAVNPINQFQKTNDAKRKSDISQIQKALEQYYQDTNSYPCSSTQFRIIGLDGSEKAWGTPFSPYLTSLPSDPSSTRRYIYYALCPSPQSYYLYASLEQGGNDPQACFSSGAVCTGVSSVPGLSATTGCSLDGSAKVCNYGATSPNISR